MKLQSLIVCELISFCFLINGPNVFSVDLIEDEIQGTRGHLITRKNDPQVKVKGHIVSSIQSNFDLSKRNLRDLFNLYGDVEELQSTDSCILRNSGGNNERLAINARSELDSIIRTHRILESESDIPDDELETLKVYLEMTQSFIDGIIRYAEKEYPDSSLIDSIAIGGKSSNPKNLEDYILDKMEMVNAAMGSEDTDMNDASLINEQLELLKETIVNWVQDVELERLIRENGENAAASMFYQDQQPQKNKKLANTMLASLKQVVSGDLDMFPMFALVIVNAQAMMSMMLSALSVQNASGRETKSDEIDSPVRPLIEVFANVRVISRKIDEIIHLV